MKIIVKYRTNKAFKDKNTKELVKVNDLLEVSVERMKELNARNVGIVEDIVVVEETPEISKEKNEKEKMEPEKPADPEGKKNHTKEELQALNVNELKELAEKEKIELTKAKKDEIISEILGE